MNDKCNERAPERRGDYGARAVHLRDATRQVTGLLPLQALSSTNTLYSRRLRGFCRSDF